VAVSAVAVVASVVVAHREDGSVTKLTEEQHEKLAAAIASVETEVAGELVVVVADASDDYRFIPTLWAATVALLVPGLYFLWEWFLAGGWQSTATGHTLLTSVYTAQVTVFLGLLLVMHWAPVTHLVVPRSVQRQRAERLAREQFLMQQLHHTTERCGTLVFISQLEHYVEILVDKGLADRVDDTHWAATVQAMQPHLKQADIASAISVAIESVGDKLREHAPQHTQNPNMNELPNRIIEL